MLDMSNRFISVLQYLGLGILTGFFFLYTVGSIYGNEDAYQSYFYFAIAVAAVMLISDINILKNYKRYYAWQFLFILFVFLSVIYTVAPNPLPHVVVLFKILLKVTTVAIICRDFDGVRKLMYCFTIGMLDVVGRLGEDIMGNANSFGLMTTVFFTGATYSALNSRNRYIMCLCIVAIVLDLWLMVLTGGRKFLLYAVFFAFSTLLAKRNIKMGRIVIIAFVASIIIAVGAYFIMNNSYLYDAIGYRFDGMASGDAEGEDVQSALMRKGIDLFLERPLFGWGVNGYVYAGGTGFYSHSNYIELLANFGIIGTLIYYSNLIWCFVVLWRNHRRGDEEFKLYFPLLLSIFVLEVFSITFNQTAYVPLFIMLISGYCYKLSKEHRYGY